MIHKKARAEICIQSFEGQGHSLGRKYVAEESHRVLFHRPALCISSIMVPTARSSAHVHPHTAVRAGGRQAAHMAQSY